MERKAYPSDVSDEEWALVAPYLTLMSEEAPQREHSLREVFGRTLVESLGRGLNLTATGKGVAVAFGWGGVLLAAAALSAINWRSRDFNLKKQRSRVRLVNAPQGAPAVAAKAEG